MKNDWRKRLVEELGLSNYTFDFPMAEITSFRIGGPADLLVEAENPTELVNVVEYCRRENIPWLLVGLGSNLLVRDGGIRGTVVRLGKGFHYVRVEGEQLKAGAGTALGRVAEVAAAHGLSGLEFASGIPGSIGGAVFMNAGAYGGEIAQVLTAAYLYHPGVGFYHRTREELAFGYRQSLLQKEGQIVLEGLFTLSRREEGEIREKMGEYNRRRKEKQPLEFPSAGSIFKRPPGAFVGRLITEAGLKGKRIGDAQVAEKHAGFIVNRGRATARDVLALIALIREEVEKRTGIKLETEVRVVGEE